MIKISDEDIMSFVKESLGKEMKERGLVQERDANKNPLRAGCGEVPAWPSYDFSKMVGKKANRADGRALLQKINITGNTIEDRVKSLNSALANAISQSAARGDDMREQFSSFILLDTIQSLAETEMYEPRAAGYLLEPIMAAVLGGEHAGGFKEIADIKFGKGGPIEISDNELNAGVSLKFVSDSTLNKEGKIKIGGSYMRLIQALLEGQGGENVAKFSFVGLIKQISKRAKARSKSDADQVDVDEELNIYFFTKEVSVDPMELRDFVENVVLSKYNAFRGENNLDQVTFDKIFTMPEKGHRANFIKVFVESLGTPNHPSLVAFRDIGHDGKGAMVIEIEMRKDSIVTIPKPSNLKQIAIKKLESINDTMANMYKNLGVLSCVMKNYLSSEATRTDLGKEVIPVSTAITAGAQTLLKKSGAPTVAQAQVPGARLGERKITTGE